jgi:hypothetical protein
MVAEEESLVTLRFLMNYLLLTNVAEKRRIQ